MWQMCFQLPFYMKNSIQLCDTKAHFSLIYHPFAKMTKDNLKNSHSSNEINTEQKVKWEID